MSRLIDVIQIVKWTHFVFFFVNQLYDKSFPVLEIRSSTYLLINIDLKHVKASDIKLSKKNERLTREPAKERRIKYPLVVTLFIQGHG